MTNAPLIRITDVSFAYRPGEPVLCSADLVLNDGERVALVGPNGSGKTTLLHLLVGLLTADSGQIEIFGKERSQAADFQDVRGPVGLLFQNADDQLFCPSVAEDVAFGPMNLGVPLSKVQDIVTDTLDQLGLRGYEQRVPYHLSVGEKRLVALATVLAMQPRVLLLDEPTAGLDQAARGRVLEVLQALPQAMILITHDQGLLEQYDGRRATLVKGRLTTAPTASE